MRIGTLIGVQVILAGAVFAQQAVVVQQKEGWDVIDSAKVRAEGLAGGISAAKFGLVGPVVKGAPYAADGVAETTQTLADGTHINRQETYSIFRDGEGRIRRERGGEVWISDPVANVSYVLNTKSQTARKLGLSNTVVYSKMALDARTAKLKAEARATMAAGVVSKAEPEKSEALGKQVMEGVEVDGARTTVVIPQGQIGNDRPIQMVSERWESAELHVTVLSKHTDPMSGDRVERLTNVRRGEPDPALFQVPAGFRVESVESDQ